MIKQNGGMLAKGRLLGVQFDTLFTDDLYFKISAHADELAMKLKKAFQKKGYLLPFYMIGYGVIRCFVEGLRTDSLYLMPGVRVSQVLSGCLILLGVLLVGIIRRRQDIQA